MQPEIHIGAVTLQTFGICFGLAFVACGAILSKRLRELGKPRDWAYEIVFSALVGGLVGARVDYIAGDWREVRIRLPLSWRTASSFGTSSTALAASSPAKYCVTACV